MYLSFGQWRHIYNWCRKIILISFCLLWHLKKTQFFNNKYNKIFFGYLSPRPALDISTSMEDQLCGCRYDIRGDPYDGIILSGISKIVGSFKQPPPISEYGRKCLPCLILGQVGRGSKKAAYIMQKIATEWFSQNIPKMNPQWPWCSASNLLDICHPECFCRGSMILDWFPIKALGWHDIVKIYDSSPHCTLNRNFNLIFPLQERLSEIEITSISLINLPRKNYTSNYVTMY